MRWASADNTTRATKGRRQEENGSNKQEATKRGQHSRQVMVNLLHIRMIVQLLEQPHDVLLLLRVAHLHCLLHLTRSTFPHERLVRELHLSLQVVLSEALVDCVQLLRLALHHHRVGLLVIDDVVGSQLDGQVEDVLLLVVLRELRMTDSGESYRDGADVVKETRGTAGGSEVAHALGEQMADFGNSPLLVVGQALNDNGAAAGTEPLVCSRLQLVRAYVTPLPIAYSDSFHSSHALCCPWAYWRHAQP